MMGLFLLEIYDRIEILSVVMPIMMMMPGVMVVSNF
jgi:hypothetical protein